MEHQNWGNRDRLSKWCLRQVLPVFVGGSIMLLLATAATVSATLLFQPLFDEGVLGKRGSILLPTVALQMALLLARGALAGIAFDLFARVSARLGQALTMKIFDHIQHHSFAYFLNRPQAELLQILRNDVAVLELNLGQIVGQATVATLQTLGAFLVLLLWEPRLALLCLVGLGAGAALIWLASRLTNRALPQEIAANAAVAEHLLMMLGLRGFFLRISSAPDWGRIRSQQLLERYRDALTRRRLLPNWILVSGEGVSTVTSFGFYLAGAYLVTGGGTSTGSLVAMAALVSYLIGSMNQLAPTYVGLGDAWLRLKRIERELANSPPLLEPKDAPMPQTIHGAFVLDRVTVRYGDKAALCEVSLHIRAGAITAIIGPSGAGKTTLSLVLLRVVEPQHGYVTIDGLSMDLYPREALWRHVGYVPQEPILFRGSVRENIMAGRPLAGSEMITAAIESGIHDCLSAMPDGYEMDVGENGYRLSAGERQRVSLARALASRPSVLVLDEPTANLDAATNAWIRTTIIDQRRAGRTVIIITHSPAIAAIADDVIALEKGVLVCDGSMADPTVEARVAQIMPDYAGTEHRATLAQQFDGPAAAHRTSGLEA